MALLGTTRSGLLILGIFVAWCHAQGFGRNGEQRRFRRNRGCLELHQLGLGGVHPIHLGALTGGRKLLRNGVETSSVWSWLGRKRGRGLWGGTLGSQLWLSPVQGRRVRPWSAVRTGAWVRHGGQPLWISLPLFGFGNTPDLSSDVRIDERVTAGLATGMVVRRRGDSRGGGSWGQNGGSSQGGGWETGGAWSQGDGWGQGQRGDASESSRRNGAWLSWGQQQQQRGGGGRGGGSWGILGGQGQTGGTDGQFGSRGQTELESQGQQSGGGAFWGSSIGQSQGGGLSEQSGSSGQTFSGGQGQIASGTWGSSRGKSQGVNGDFGRAGNWGQGQQGGAGQWDSSVSGGQGGFGSQGQGGTGEGTDFGSQESQWGQQQEGGTGWLSGQRGSSSWIGGSSTGVGQGDETGGRLFGQGYGRRGGFGDGGAQWRQGGSSFRDQRGSSGGQLQGGSVGDGGGSGGQFGNRGGGDWFWGTRGRSLGSGGGSGFRSFWTSHAGRGSPTRWRIIRYSLPDSGMGGYRRFIRWSSSPGQTFQFGNTGGSSGAGSSNLYGGGFRN